ncbi:MAG: diguanylate cyclase [Lachnospiraceae bacterium]|nr:diguanylate cyclase [Lachnospiraceae bacterium]
MKERNKDRFTNYLREAGVSDREASALVKKSFETIFFDEKDGFVYRTQEDAWCVVDTGNDDVRTEGMSYGMMMCVQMDEQEIFDKLWTFVMRYMLITEGRHAGYFAWSVGKDGRVNHADPAPDGEEYFAMALIMASERWGEGEGIFRYAYHAREILRHCVHQHELVDGGEPMFDPDNHMIRFVPDMKITDPSYHLPHFYELFAKFADEEDRPFFREAAKVSRDFLVTCAHETTGLCPEYAEYDGMPRALFDKPYTFYSDAYRVMENIALDHLWFGAHPEVDAITTRVQDFFAGKDLMHLNASGIDGTDYDEPVMHPVGLTATLAAASVCSKSEHRLEFLQKFVQMPMRTGKRRYYDNCLYFLCLLILTGNYQPYGLEDKGRSERKERKGKIAIFANGWNNEFLRLVLEGVRKRAKRDKVDIFAYISYIYWSEKGIHKKSQLNIFHLPDPKTYDGAIMLTNTFNTMDERERVCKLFGRARVPVVSSEIRIDGLPYVGTDNYGGMYELAEHLITQHDVKDVVYIAGIEGNEESRIRQMALEDALDAHGLKLSEVLSAGFEFYQASLIAEGWLEKGKKLPDAFICANDHMALGMISAFHKRGIEAPGDVIITGFDHDYEARTSYPLLSTVSRQWEDLGIHLYDALMDQIRLSDPSFQKIYPSTFVASESCGCPGNKTDAATRVERLRNYYADIMKRDIDDLFYHELRIHMAKVENRFDFFTCANESWAHHDVLGPDFCICAERDFFEADDQHYPVRIRGYSSEMDIIFEKKNGKATQVGTFPTKEVYPGYRRIEGNSDIYLMTPLSHMGYVIGYLAVKNDPEIFYDLAVTKSIINLNALFLAIRHYILSQQNNRKLQQIYMTDALSGMYNRMGCEQKLFPFVDAAHEEGKTVLLLFVDIDRMKQINDGYGHLSGDLAIRACAKAVCESLPDDWLLGRYGGDEFMAAGVSDMDPALYRDRILTRLHELALELRVPFDLSVSVGCHTIKPEEPGTVSDFVRIADEAMYEQKKRARHEV